MGWVEVALVIASLVIGYASRPKIEDPALPVLDDLEVPTAEDGRVIPVLFGTRDIKSTNCVWYGDLLVLPFKQRRRSNWKVQQAVNGGNFINVS